MSSQPMLNIRLMCFSSHLHQIIFWNGNDPQRKITCIRTISSLWTAIWIVSLLFGCIICDTLRTTSACLYRACSFNLPKFQHQRDKIRMTFCTVDVAAGVNLCVLQVFPGPQIFPGLATACCPLASLLAWPLPLTWLALPAASFSAACIHRSA